MPSASGYVAYWCRSNHNLVLKQFLSLLQAHPRSAVDKQRVVRLTVETAVLLYFFALLRQPL